MKPASPLDVVAQLVNAINTCDLEMALGLFEQGATFVAKPGIVLNGTSEIRQALAGFMALKPTLTIETQQIVEAGDLRNTVPDGINREQILRETRCTLVADPPSSFVAKSMERGSFCWIIRGERTLSRSSHWA